MASVVDDTSRTDGEDLTSGVCKPRKPFPVLLSLDEISRLTVLMKENQR